MGGEILQRKSDVVMNNVHPAGVQCTLMTILGNARFSPAHWLMFETYWIYYFLQFFMRRFVSQKSFFLHMKLH